MEANKLSCEIAGKTLTIETGEIANQTNGSVFVRYGDSVVLVTATAAQDGKEGLDFVPLTVDYIEKAFAAGKIPGGFFKRETRPGVRETLISRLIDRPIRPLFPDWWNHETFIVATVLSTDQENDPDLVAMIGASAVLTISNIPFTKSIGAVRVGRKNGTLILNPTTNDLLESDLNMVVAGTKDAIVMVEGGSKELSEEEIVEALAFAHKGIIPIVELQEKFQKKCGVDKITETKKKLDEKIVKIRTTIEEIAKKEIPKLFKIKVKKERGAAFYNLKKDILEKHPEIEENEVKGFINSVFEEESRNFIRNVIVSDKKRVDGRDFDEIRKVDCKVGYLPRTHGSSLFTRGETQALVVVTLGTSEDEQIIDDLTGDYKKSFMLHYNFPPFSVGEAKPLRGPGRREVGHGALAERAISHVLPDSLNFPYTIRIVSEILSSNGSSSMASICGSTLALMDAGVPITAPVAGIAMGLVKEEKEHFILTDILGEEDHVGDMDFKVAGTVKGITAIQMDIKIDGIDEKIFTDALMQAKTARLKLLDIMSKTLDAPRKEISTFAPRICTIYVPTSKIKDIIGPGGKNIKAIIEETKVKIDIDDTGKVNIASASSEACQRAIDIISRYSEEVVVGKIYTGKVKRLMDFGAFVEILPGTEGLVHISHLANERVRCVGDVVREGDEIAVKVLEIDGQGRIRLSRKEALGANNPKK